MGGADLSTTIGRATGSAGFDENGMPLYRNKNTESAADKAKRKANREIKEMAERLSADQSIIVSFPAQLNKERYKRFNHNFGEISNRVQLSISSTPFKRIN